VGALDREDVDTSTGKFKAVLEQLKHKERNLGPLKLVFFADLLEAEGVRELCEENCCIAQFGAGRTAPGPLRTRGKCFPLTLQCKSDYT